MGNDSEDGRKGVLKLNGPADIETFEALLLAELQDKDLLLAVNGKDDAERNPLSQKALAVIILKSPSRFAARLRQCGSALEGFNYLLNFYRGAKDDHKRELQRQFRELKLGSGMLMDDYVMKREVLEGQLNGLGYKLDKSEFNDELLNGLPEAYDPYRTELRGEKDRAILFARLRELQSLFARRAAEKAESAQVMAAAAVLQRLQQQQQQQGQQWQQGGGGGRGKSKVGRGGGRGGGGRGRGNQGSEDPNRYADYKCNQCKRLGHIAKHCPQRKQQQGQQGGGGGSYGGGGGAGGSSGSRDLQLASGVLNVDAVLPH
jgi:hypothetical protein